MYYMSTSLLDVLKLPHNSLIQIYNFVLDEKQKYRSQANVLIVKSGTSFRFTYFPIYY